MLGHRPRATFGEASQEYRNCVANQRSGGAIIPFLALTISLILVVGAIMAALRFRKALLLVPVAVMLTVWFLPGVTGRMQEGISTGGSDTISAER